MTLLPMSFRPRNTLTHRSSKSPKNPLTTNINRKLSTFPACLRSTSQYSPHPCLRSHSLCHADSCAKIPEVAIQTLELGFNFPFKERFELFANDGFDEGFHECGQDIMFRLGEVVSEMTDVDVHLIDLIE